MLFQDYTIIPNLATTSYTLNEKKSRSFAKRMATEEIYDVKLAPSFDNEKLVDIVPQLHKIFSEILTEVRPSDIRDTDFGRIYVNHPDLSTPITVPPTQWHDIDADTVLRRIEHVLSSKSALRVTDGFEIHVGSVRIPSGEGRSKVKYVLGDNTCLDKKKSIVRIKNEDTLCLPRAIVAAQAKADGQSKYHKIKRSHHPLQTYMALNVIHDAGNHLEDKFDILDIPDFKEVRIYNSGV